MKLVQPRRQGRWGLSICKQMEITVIIPLSVNASEFYREKLGFLQSDLDLSSNLILSLISCVTLGKLLNLSEPHLYSEVEQIPHRVDIRVKKYNVWHTVSVHLVL